MPPLGLRHLALRVKDPQASKRFYQECFGMKIVWEPDPDNVYLSSGIDNLALHRDAVEGPGALDHFGFVVGSKEEVDAVMEQARMAGAEIVKFAEDTFWGGYSGYFQDPDQHLWEVVWNPELIPPD